MAEGDSSYCSPHVFTSALLGVLSCVLMAGGVFLAFHRWDPTWLVVSGVGAVLVLVGTVLHCCAQPRRSTAATGKGCPVEHQPPAATSLTEQLLPLGNARSVSQLSLNMLPGYFPPVVTAYGIEQHSAVVQNINRVVQLQQPQISTVPTGAGRNFILLSLPEDATAANIQNLVATVYQIDGNQEAGSQEAAPQPSVFCAKPLATTSLVLKNAEVQTCSAWPTSTPRSAVATATAAMTTQTDDPTHPIDLMDCSVPDCDSISNVPSTESEIIVNVSGTAEEPVVEPASDALVNVSENSPCPAQVLSADSRVEDISSSESPEFSLSASSSGINLTATDEEVDEGDRSSPPPSYDDVAQRHFSLAYGTL